MKNQKYKIILSFSCFLVLLFFVLHGSDIIKTNSLKNYDLKQTENISDNNLNSIEKNNTNTSEETQINNFVEEVITFINNEDYERLHSCLDSELQNYLTTEDIKYSIKDYKLYFDNERIVDYKFQGEDENCKYKNNESIFIFRLKNESGKEKDIQIIKYKGETYVVFDRLIYYSHFKEQKMNSFINAIKKENVELLSQIIYLDETGNCYPEKKTLEVLEQYKNYFDITTIDWQFTGELGEYNEFICKIFGKKNGEEVEHLIKVISGDGQVGISDEWIVNYYDLE